MEKEISTEPMSVVLAKIKILRPTARITPNAKTDPHPPYNKELEKDEKGYYFTSGRNNKVYLDWLVEQGCTYEFKDAKPDYHFVDHLGYEWERLPKGPHYKVIKDKNSVIERFDDIN